MAIYVYIAQDGELRATEHELYKYCKDGSVRQIAMADNDIGDIFAANIIFNEQKDFFELNFMGYSAKAADLRNGKRSKIIRRARNCSR